tara:strand:+ start:342 stop:776 length:435 start_codon:yes stop_codon:yes gene_type:complete
MTNRKTTVKAEGKYTIEDMQKHASVASTADGLKLEGPNFKLTCLTACPDMLLFACEELAKANELADELLARVGEAEARLASAAITGKGSYPSDALKKFALKKKFEALSDLLTDHEIMFDSENVGVHSQKIKSQIERLDEAIKNG